MPEFQQRLARARQQAIPNRRAPARKRNFNNDTDLLYWPIQRCANATTSSTSFGKAAAIAAVAVDACPTVGAGVRLAFTGLHWSPMATDAYLQSRLVAALGADVANAVGVSEDNVASGAIQQSTSSAAGTDFTFSLHGDTASDAATSVSALTTVLASGSQWLAASTAAIADILILAHTVCLGNCLAEGASLAGATTAPNAAAAVVAPVAPTGPTPSFAVVSAAAPRAPLVAFIASAAAIAALLVAG